MSARWSKEIFFFVFFFASFKKQAFFPTKAICGFSSFRYAYTLHALLQNNPKKVYLKLKR